MLSDFFIATPTEVQTLDINKSPATNGMGLRAKAVDPVKIVQLQCCIDGVPFSDQTSLLDNMLVRQGGEEGPWIFHIPEALEDRLAVASTEELERFGNEWAMTEEWRRDGGTPQTVIPFLLEIVGLVTVARAQGRSVYLWLSL